MKKLRPQRVNFGRIRRFLASAQKKPSAAKKTLEVDEEAAYELAYEAMLKASLGYMLSFGVRPRSLPGHHVAIIEFCQNRLGRESRDVLRMFDRMRRKRHQAIYDVSGFISQQEARHALETAENYLAIVREGIERKNPQARLL